MSTIIKMARLKKRIEQSKGLVIYGAGYLAKILITEFAENGIFVNYCVVSHRDKDTNSFEKIPLYEFENCICDMQKDNVITLIAVTELYEKEIEKNLQNNQIKNYLFVTEYVRTNDLLEYYSEKTEQEYLTEVAEWYVDKKRLALQDIEIIKKQFEYIINKRKYYEDKIVFAVGNPSPRVVKMLDALHEKGYQVDILFYAKAWNYENFYNQLVEKCANHFNCNTIEELMYYMILSHAKVIHLFSHINISDIAYILIKQKQIFPKLVFDQYDIANEMYITTYSSSNSFTCERYCLEHADGLCCRGYEQEYLIKEKQYKLCKNIIQFFDYCQSETFFYEGRDKTEELSLCYAGGIATEREWPEAPYACFLEFAKLCEKKQCHFHVYPSTWDENRFMDYILLDKKSDYFHFHRPVPFEILKRELLKYDYGVHLMKQGYLEKDYSGYITRNKTIYSVTNHFYDYLDAGLPIIAATPVRFSQEFEKEGVLLNWTIEEYDFDELRRRREELKNKVVAVRKKWSIGRKIEELISFYNAL